MTYDLVIKNGTVVDGTGKARYQADVAIADGKVAEIGKVTVEQVRDAAKQLSDFRFMKMLAVGAVGPQVADDIKAGLKAGKVPSKIGVRTFNHDAWIAAMQPTWNHHHTDHDA